eukprot:SAG31_NODE_6211_length_2119_cov_1.903960_1_plen_664_part_01
MGSEDSIEQRASDGVIGFKGFFSLWAKGSQFDKSVVQTIRCRDVNHAKELIQQKIQQKITGGPAGLRRAFQLFDSDGSGHLSKTEFKQALQERGLVFEPEMLDKVFRSIAVPKDEIDYHNFARELMQSRVEDKTSFATGANVGRGAGSAVEGTTEPQIRRKVRECMKLLQVAFHHADVNGTGEVSHQTLRNILERHDIMMPDPQWNSLIRKMDANSDGSISYEEFFSFFRMGQPDEQLDAIVGTIMERNISVPKALELIQEKITAKLPSGPSELRRTFQMFDRDGGGSISLEELRDGLRLQCGLQFEPALLRKIMAHYGGTEDGRGELDFKMFSHMVMGSSTSSATSFGQYKRSSRSTNNDEGNSDAAIRRKVQEEQKPLRRALKHASDENGYLTPAAFRDVLFHMDIVMEDDRFSSLIQKMGAKSRVPGKVNGAMLFKIYGKGSKADLEVLATIKNVSVTKAKEMIQDKIRGRLPSGPAELRRTFQFFDRDGGGTVSIDEFKYALKRYCGLQFEENLLQKLIAEFDKDGSGELDFAKFSQLVLGSTPETDGTSVTDNSALLAISDDNGNSDMMLRRKVREKWRSLITMFKQTSDASGDLTPAQLKSVLYKHDILVAEKQFHVMLAEMDDDGDGVISYSEFLKYFDKGQADEVSLTPTITAMPL